MKQDIENIIRTNLPEEVDDDGFAHDPSVAFNNGFDEALSQINTSLIADEVLKVERKMIKEQKIDEGLESSQYEAVEKFRKQLLSNLSHNKENKSNSRNY